MMRFEWVRRYHSIACIEDDHMGVAIRQISAEHVEGFHRALDHVARERKYPALAETREFVMNNIATPLLEATSSDGAMSSPGIARLLRIVAS